MKSCPGVSVANYPVKNVVCPNKNANTNTNMPKIPGCPTMAGQILQTSQWQMKAHLSLSARFFVLTSLCYGCNRYKSKRVKVQGALP